MRVHVEAFAHLEAQLHHAGLAGLDYLRFSCVGYITGRLRRTAHLLRNQKAAADSYRTSHQQTNPEANQ